MRRGAASDDGERALRRAAGTTTGTTDGRRRLHAVEAKADTLHLQEDFGVAGHVEELAQLAIRVNGDGQRFVRHGIALVTF